MRQEQLPVPGRRPSSRLLIATAGALSLAAAAKGDPLVEEKTGVTIDWRRGAIVASAGAAGDHRMPTADAARPGAERRALAAARARIAETLRELPLGGGRRLDESAVSRAVSRARTTTVEYQSNGGALVRVEVAFGDWAEEKPRASPPSAPASEDKEPSSLPLWLARGHLAAAPVVVIGGREMVLGGARYMTAAGVPTGVQALTVHADKQGRLLVDDGAGTQELAGRQALIYVQKVLR